jgi:RNA polymerase sigma-70 factor (ECF subfamily)
VPALTRPRVVGVSDASLIATSLDDPAVFAAVFDRHWPRIHRFCVSRAGAAGEDLAAEAFRIAFDERGRYDGAHADAAPWLYGIATNLLRRWFRGQARGAAAVARSDRPEARDPADDTLSRVEAGRLGPELAAALATISAADRDALLLYAWADLTYEQIAQATAVPVGTVRSRIHRARTQVRAHLATTPEDHR